MPGWRAFIRREVPVSSASPITEADQVADPDAVDADRSGRKRSLSAPRVVALVLAVAFLAGAVGFAVSEHGRDPLSATDVGFMQDMSYHHEQAVQLSLILIGKTDVDPELQSYAKEILVGQRFEMGVMNATLDRFGRRTDPGETSMGWMGPAMPLNSMEGLATDAQVVELRQAEGVGAESLFIALMTDHHLGGLHMADWEARHGKDATTVNLAASMVFNQRGEVIDMDRYRRTHGVPLADGFSDPLEDHRLNPLSVTGR